MGSQMRKKFVNKMMLEMVPSARYMFSCVEAQNYIKKVDIDQEEWQQWVFENPPKSTIFRVLGKKDLTVLEKCVILVLRSLGDGKKRIRNTTRATSRK